MKPEREKDRVSVWVRPEQEEFKKVETEEINRERRKNCSNSAFFPSSAFAVKDPDCVSFSFLFRVYVVNRNTPSLQRRFVQQGKSTRRMERREKTKGNELVCYMNSRPSVQNTISGSYSFPDGGDQSQIMKTQSQKQTQRWLQMGIWIYSIMWRRSARSCSYIKSFNVSPVSV